MTQPATDDFTVGWICALQEEYEAGCRMLDEEFDDLEAENADDHNTYVFGRIGRHYVIIGCLPAGRYGTNSAAVTARDMARSFPRVKFALMVGIGGGAPTVKDIRLGDVVVSQPHGTLGGVVQYDFGKRLPGDRFQRTGQLNSPPEFLLGVIPEIQRRHNDPRKPDNLSKHLKLMEDKPGYECPMLDRLYLADYVHQGGATCTNCVEDGFKERPDRSPRNRPFEVHYGTIASANSVMKDAKERDQLAMDPEFNALCFEMEAAGLMNNFPCLVIRGICDYSDSHKNDDWHNYAALTASAYARELLHVLKPRKVKEAPAWAGEMIQVIENFEGKLLVASEKTDTLIRHQLSNEEEIILNWLSSTNYGLQQTAHFENREPGTGEWFLQSEEYLHWLGTRNDVLLGTGIPGAGKTIIASIAISDLNSRFHHCQNVSIAYVFCDYRQQDHQTARSLLSSLLRQLTACLPKLPDTIRSLYNEHKPKGTQPSLVQISERLQSVISMCERSFIVVDALDESAASDCRNNLIRELFTLVDLGANLFATSRPLPEIMNMFLDEHTELNIQASELDVQRYLKRRIDNLRPFQQGTYQQDREYAKQQLTHAAEGMFLLAKIYIDSLQDAFTVNDVLDGVKRILVRNEGHIGDTDGILEDAYDTAMARIHQQTTKVVTLALKALAWVCFAKVPLTTSQLEEAMAVRHNQESLDRRDVPQIGDVVSVCIGLVTINQQSGLVELTHYTTKEYLERRRETLFANAESEIASSCVTYLCYSTFNQNCKSDHEFQRRQIQNSLYTYCAKYWGYHAREAPTIEIIITFLGSAIALESACQAMILSSAPFRNTKYQPDAIYEDDSDSEGLEMELSTAQWIAWDHAFEKGFHSAIASGASPNMTGSHLLAYFGLSHPQYVTSQSDSLNSVDIFGKTPISWAAERGFEFTVQSLLEVGEVNINTPDKSNRTPLWLAVERGHLAVVELLLDVPDVDVDTKDASYGEGPLLLAACNNKQSIVKAFLDRQVKDTNFRNNYRELVFEMIKREFNGILELFLGRDHIEWENLDHNGQTNLFYAASNCLRKSVKMLLKSGKVDPDTQDARGETPLWVAVQKGNRIAVELLLQTKRVDTNQRNKEGHTLLSMAAKESTFPIINILLNDDTTELDVKDQNGLTPLEVALLKPRSDLGRIQDRQNLKAMVRIYIGRIGPERAVELLTEMGNHEYSKSLLHNQSALEWAIRNRSWSIVDYILYAGRTDLERESILVQWVVKKRTACCEEETG